MEQWKLYRIEDSRGLGPYCSDIFDLAVDGGLGEEALQAARIPTPEDLGIAPQIGWSFAFTSKKSMARYIPVRLLEFMLGRGYQVREYLVDECIPFDRTRPARFDRR